MVALEVREADFTAAANRFRSIQTFGNGRDSSAVRVRNQRLQESPSTSVGRGDLNQQSAIDFQKLGGAIVSSTRRDCPRQNRRRPA